MNEQLRGRLIEEATESDSLSPEEKDTGITFTKHAEERNGRDVARIYSEEAGIMRRLLAHEHFEIDWVRIEGGGQSEPSDVEKGDGVTCVSGWIPIGCLSVRPNPSTQPGHARMVTGEYDYPEPAQ